VFKSPLFKSTVFKSLVFKSLVFKSLVFKSPLFKSTLFKSTVFKSLVFKSPLFKSTVFNPTVFRVHTLAALLLVLPLMGIAACNDADGDGHPSTTDCDDTDPEVHPGQTEACNGIDDNCDGVIDEGFTTLYYPDQDGDLYGDASAPVQSCDAPSGMVTEGGDCDDSSAAIHPGATEVVNGLDDDCDGVTDETVNTDLERWVMIYSNLQVDANILEVKALLDRAATAGYTHIMLYDYKFNILDYVQEWYWENAQEVIDHAASLGLVIYPQIATVGYSDGLLFHDPNLVSAMPVVDSRYLVQGGLADVAQDPATSMRDPGFEVYSGDTFTEWDYQDSPGRVSFVDTAVKKEGQASIRFENLKGSNGRVYQVVTVQPWHAYHVRFWVKTDAFASSSGVKFYAADAETGIELSFNNLGIQPTQDWTEHHMVFNSREYTQVRIYAGSWSGTTGRLWLDGGLLEEVGPLNITRREGTPLKVTDLSGALEYEEGVDFARLEDPLLGPLEANGYSYSLYHPWPKIEILPGGAIREGETLRVSWYHALIVLDSQVANALKDPKVLEIIDHQVTGVRDLFQPPGYYMSVDEYRAGGWDAQERATGKTAGGLLSDFTTELVGVFDRVDPGSDLLVWSDMYDPYHNAHEDFYLTYETMAESWVGLPSRVSIGNWNSHNEDSLWFFARRGHPQLLCGYVDAEPAANLSIDDWLTMSLDMGGVRGVMFVTWVGDYSKLEAFAETVDAWEAAHGG